MLGFIIGLFLAWYFYNFIENNSYLMNVFIYAIASFITYILNALISGQPMHIVFYIIASIIVALICVKVMEFVKAITRSLLNFIIVTDLINIVVFLAIGFLINVVFV